MALQDLTQPPLTVKRVQRLVTKLPVEKQEPKREAMAGLGAELVHLH